MAEEFNPSIIAFACNWCAYSAADLAGVSRFQYPPNLKIIRVMCSGRINPEFVLHAFAQGADGVAVTGCHFGDCHYLFGNHRQVDIFARTKALVTTLGLEEDRVDLDWISAAEGVRYGQYMDAFVEKIRGLGKSPIRAALEFQREEAGGESPEPAVAEVSS